MAASNSPLPVEVGEEGLVLTPELEAYLAKLYVWDGTASSYRHLPTPAERYGLTEEQLRRQARAWAARSDFALGAYIAYYRLVAGTVHGSDDAVRVRADALLFTIDGCEAYEAADRLVDFLLDTRVTAGYSDERLLARIAVVLPEETKRAIGTCLRWRDQLAPCWHAETDFIQSVVDLDWDHHDAAASAGAESKVQ